MPPSIATMPSSRLHSSRNWMQAAAPSHTKDCESFDPASLAVIRHTAPSAAKTTLTGIAFGVRPASFTRRASDCAQARSRVFR